MSSILLSWWCPLPSAEIRRFCHSMIPSPSRAELGVEVKVQLHDWGCMPDDLLELVGCDGLGGVDISNAIKYNASGVHKVARKL
jgi:hypothetical protein